MILVDTDVLSDLRKPRPSTSVVDWFRGAAPAELFVSVITIMEIRAGVEQKRKNDREFADRLENWLDATIANFSDRILPLDTEVALRWGQMPVRFGRNDMDVAIAATALEHGFAIATRNVRHYTSMGVKTLNPFDA